MRGRERACERLVRISAKMRVVAARSNGLLSKYKDRVNEGLAPVAEAITTRTQVDATRLRVTAAKELPGVRRMKPRCNVNAGSTE